jgi:hypothetical protein
VRSGMVSRHSMPLIENPENMDTPPPASSDDSAFAPTSTADAPRTAAAAELFGNRGGKAQGATPKPLEDTWDAEDSLLSWRLIAGIVAVLVLVGFGAYKVFGGSKADDTTKTGTGATTPEGDGIEIIDSFSGSSTDGLGKADTGQEWEVPAGKWGKTDSHAFVADPNKEGGGRTMALVELGSTNGSVSAKVAKMAPGWALVFRYKGQFNYWLVTASPKFATYNLVKVADGKATPMGKIQAKQDDGTVVGVQFQGPNITIVVNDKAVLTISDTPNGAGTKVGIAAADATAKDAQWSEFNAKSGKGATSVPTVAPAGKVTTTAKAGAPSTTAAAGSDGPTSTAPKATGAVSGAPTTSTSTKKDARSG